MPRLITTRLGVMAASLLAASTALADPAAVCKGKTLNLLLETVPDSTALIEVAPEFEALSGAKLNMEAVNYSLMHEKLVPSLTASSGSYDVLAVDSYWAGEFVTANWIQPLDERIAADKIDTSVYYPALMDVNGKVKDTTYMLPFWQYAMGMLYRKDIVEDPAFQAAYKENFGRDWRLPETLQEYAEVAKWAGQHTGKAGVAMSGQRADPVVMEATNYVFSLGADFYDRETWEPALGSPEGIEAVTIYADLLANAAQPGALGANFDDVANTLKQDKAVFAISYLFLMPTLQDPKESQVVDKVAFARMPGEDSLLGAWGWSIPTNAANPDCSWEFIKWVESRDVAMKRAMAGGQATQAWIYDDAEYLKLWPQMAAVGDALAHAKGLPVMSRATQLVEVFAEVMGDVLANGTDPATAIANAEDKFARLTRGDPLLK
ncbi:extracellular solute-binding protein [Shinella daejeonensis]|uniref:extracellular solute-binding protein n=1 Tax=Shinella daejeonensis TaxID=659017 RepID=UPI0020C7D1B6|nr:extracellular solute-binding protein [Shinella daejeonensis]MCP8896861.1 extracellular solute-binding protein [Shinella daejeonensis]